MSIPHATTPGRLRPLARLLLSLLPAILISSPALAAPDGAQIYRRQCTSCHGPSGEGTEDHPRPLTGDRSVAQLAALITKSMPKDAPEKCTGEDAAAVAGYIHDAFYSKLAQERNKPARIALARLTVAQHANALADLIGSFRAPGVWGEQRGLHGEYFTSRRFSRRQRALDRLDPGVHFDFKEGSPNPKIEPEEFAIRWSGAIFAPETGDYEFILRTRNGARLWVNDTDRPLIDAWVRSGTDIERKESLRLLGGRAYPLRLEFYKSSKAKEKTAAIALEWKPPHGVAGPIPVRHLSPERFPETFVTTTPFPPDDRSLGWERGTTVSREWSQAVTAAAIEAAGHVVAHLNELAGGRGSDRDAEVRDFLRTFAERAFRRPLTEEQKRLYIDRQFVPGRDLETSVKRVVLLVLESPRFLYPDLGPPDSYRVASRLSFTLWDSLPDQELLDAAAAGKLATREQVARQAERMLADPRARVKFRNFLHYLLKIDHAGDLVKDPKRFPEFGPAVVADLRTSLDLFLDDTVWGESSDFRQLLLSGDLYLNDRLAKIYGGAVPAGAGFHKVSADGGKRAGVLTHPYLMANFAYTGTSSPIHRGVFLLKGVLGRTLRPPPAAFTPLAEDLHPDLTTRQRVALQTRGKSCQMCHGMINPLGFTLEHFDAIGRYRDKERGKPIDAAGAYETVVGKAVKFSGARDLARFLADSEEVHAAFVEHLFHHLVKQPVRAYGADMPGTLRQAFARDGYSIRKLAVEIATVSALHGVGEKPPPR
jgi:hypothetical protein